MVLAGQLAAGFNSYSVHSTTSTRSTRSRHSSSRSSSSSSSSSTSSSDAYAEHDPAEPNARLTLQDEFDPALYHSTEWEVSAEEESCCEEESDRDDRRRDRDKDRNPGRGRGRGQVVGHGRGELPRVASQPTSLQANATRSTSKLGWAALRRLLRPFKWKSVSGLLVQTNTRPGLQHRASLNRLPKVHDSPDLGLTGKRREASTTHPSVKKKRRRRRSQTRPDQNIKTVKKMAMGTSDLNAPGASNSEAKVVQEEKKADTPGPSAASLAPVAEDQFLAKPPTVRYKFYSRKHSLWRRKTNQEAAVKTSCETERAQRRDRDSNTSSIETTSPKKTLSFFGTARAIRSALSLARKTPGNQSSTCSSEFPQDQAGQSQSQSSVESSMPGSANHSRTASPGPGSSSNIHSLTTTNLLESQDSDELRPLSICTANCRYDVVRRVSKRFGMKDVSEDEPWNLYWTDLSISLERCKDMKRFQKINHFPGMAEICRKDLLARNLNRMLRLFPKDYNFFPKTWCLPADLGDLCAYARSRRNRTYILKPDTGCQGKGIYLTKNVRDLKPHTRMICQVYIAKPFLVDGFKFDMRVYTLVTSCDPLRVFVYNDGLVRFATSPYHEPNSHNTTNVFMHLTNYAVNKHSRAFVVDDEAGSKRKISTLNRWLESKNYGVKEIWERIDELIVKTLIAALPVIRHNYHACFPAHDFTYACFELLGFDILLDHKLKPYILEVNHSPSFHTDAQIDREVKESLLNDTFGILNLTQYDKKKVMEEDRRRVRDRLLQSIAHKENSDCSMTSNENNPWKAQFDWEDKNMGNYRRIYPCDTGGTPETPDKYETFFHQNQSSLFQETAASRAREEASRLQRDMYECPYLYRRVAVELAREEASRLRQKLLKEVKQKEEEARRPTSLARRREYERLRPESPLGGRRNKNTSSVAQRIKRAMALPIGQGKKAPVARSVLNSFQPETISESEESVRAAALAERSQLIQNAGIIPMIYNMLKENKSLCAEDLRKYAALDADARARDSSRRDEHRDASVVSNKLPSLLTLIQKTTGHSAIAEANRPKCTMDTYEPMMLGIANSGLSSCLGSGDSGEPPSVSTVTIPVLGGGGGGGGAPGLAGPAFFSGLGVVCAEAPFGVRPGLRAGEWASHTQLAQLTQHAAAANAIRPSLAPRLTRSTMGRLVSSSLKLHDLEKRQATKSQAL